MGSVSIGLLDIKSTFERQRTSQSVGEIVQIESISAFYILPLNSEEVVQVIIESFTASITHPIELYFPSFCSDLVPRKQSGMSRL